MTYSLEVTPDKRLEQFQQRLSTLNCRLPNYVGEPGAERFLPSHHPEARRFIQNDGSRTYLVHAAHERELDSIMREGLRVPTSNGALHSVDDGRPALWQTAFMLEGPDGIRPQTKTNVLLMDYRYFGRFRTDSKVVIEVPTPRPPEEPTDDFWDNLSAFRAIGDVATMQTPEMDAFVVSPSLIIGAFVVRRSVGVVFRGNDKNS